MKLSDDRRWFLVEDRRIPVVHAEVLDTPMGEHRPPFRVRRCLIKGEGWALSIIWGDATYSDNYNARNAGELSWWGDDDTLVPPFTEDPETVEAMVVDGPRTDAEPRHNLYGWQVLDLIDELDRVRSTSVE